MLQYILLIDGPEFTIIYPLVDLMQTKRIKIRGHIDDLVPNVL